MKPVRIKGATINSVGLGRVGLMMADTEVFVSVPSVDDERALGERLYQPVMVTLSAGDALADRDRAWARLLRAERLYIGGAMRGNFDAHTELEAAKQALRDLGVPVDALLEEA